MITKPKRSAGAETSVVNGGEAVVRALEANGVAHVFGIPGTHTLPIDAHLAKSSIRHVQPRHEQGAGFAADGYARASRRPGVCLVTSGPGVTNIATAAAQAYSDSVPMLIVSPGMPADAYRRGSGFLHEAKDQSGAMENLVSWSHRATSPADVAATINRAFVEFATMRPRPVHLEIPLDVLEAREGVDFRVGRSGTRPAPDDASVEQAALMLEQARRPALIVGGGAQDAADEVAELAHRLDAIVTTTANGKGTFPENDELALGVALGYPAGRTALASCDVWVAIGTELSLVDLEGEPLNTNAKVIRIDIDPRQRDMNLACDCWLHSDAALAISALLARLQNSRARESAALVRDWRRKLDADIEARAAGTTAAARAIASCVDDHTIVVCDTSMLCYNGVIPTRFARRSRSCLNPTGYATLGYALPAGIGAKLALSDRSVLVVCGDGGLLFTLEELSLAVDLGLQVVIVVVNNRGYGEIRQAMMARGIEPFGVTFNPPRLPALAEAFGARSATANGASELERHIRAAFTADGPTLIETIL